MQLWAKAATGRLRELGLNVAPGPTAEGRGRRVLSLHQVRAAAREMTGRDADDRAAACLVLSIAATEIEVALIVPPGGLDGLRSHLVTPERSLELTTALESLPEQFTLGLGDRATGLPSPDGPRAPASSAATDEIRALIEGAVREQAPIWLGWTVPRELAIAHADVLDEQLEDALVALGSVFGMLASVTDEGSAAVRARASPSKDRRESAGADEDGGGERWRVTRQRQRDIDRERGRESDSPAEVAPERDAGSPRASRAVSGRPVSRAGTRRRPVVPALAAGGSIEKGVRVRVLDGPFMGKAGVVQELDGKGGVRVMLGLLAVRLHVKDLARCAEGRDRPVLPSSHRKPLPARS